MTPLENTDTSLADRRPCPKCGRANPPDAERCAQCQCHLLVWCKHCHRTVFRGASHCPFCQKPLHHGQHAFPDEAERQARHKIAFFQSRTRWLELAVFLAAVLGALVVIIKLSNTDIDRLKPVPRDQMTPEEREKDNIDRQVFEGKKR